MGPQACYPPVSAWYPEVLYDGEEVDCQKEWIVRPLWELCAVKLISNKKLIPLRRYNGLPQKLLDIFMTAAIKFNIHFPFPYLITAWRSHRFRMELPEFLKNWQLFFLMMNVAFISYHISKLQKIAYRILRRTASELYASRGPFTNIRYIDFSEVLVRDAILLDICELINRKYKSNKCRHCSQKHKPGIPEDGKCCCDACQRLVIKLNCIAEVRTIGGVCTALRACKNGTSLIQLIVAGVHVGLGVVDDLYELERYMWRKIHELLGLFDPEHVEIFCCPDFYHDHDPSCLYQYIRSFRNLKILDLSYNCIDGPRPISALAEVIETLRHLKQLRLSGNCMTSCLQMLLDKTHAFSLDELALSDCVLSRLDFMNLSWSHHTRTLKRLDISCNVLTPDSLETLLLACEQLRILEIHTCCFRRSEVDADFFFNLLARIPNLRYVNLAGFENIDSEYIESKVHLLKRKGGHALQICALRESCRWECRHITEW